MRILILTDGSKSVGAGHVSRMRAIASYFDSNTDILFVANIDKSLEKILANYKYINFDWLKDVDSVIIEYSHLYDVVIVDSYSYTLEDAEAIESRFRKTIFMDDYFRIQYPNNSHIINYTVGIEKYANRYKSHKLLNYLDNLLLGAKYFPLNHDIVSKVKFYAEKRTDVLIMFGGTDALGLTGVASSLAGRFPEIKFHIAGGVFNSSFEKYSNITYHGYVDASKMASIFSQCKIAIGGVGGSSYELAYAGIRLFGVQIADNQKYNIEGWLDSEFLELVTIEQLRNLEFVERFNELYHNSWDFKLWHKIIDGKGGVRIKEHIEYMASLR